MTQKKVLPGKLWMTINMVSKIKKSLLGKVINGGYFSWFLVTKYKFSDHGKKSENNLDILPVTFNSA